MEEKQQHIGPQLPKDIHEAVGRVSACLRHAHIEFNNMLHFLTTQGYYTRPVMPPVLDTAVLDEQLGATKDVGQLYNEAAAELSAKSDTEQQLTDLIAATEERAVGQAKASYAEVLSKMPAATRIEAPVDLTLKVGEKPVVLQKGDKILMHDGVIMVQRVNENESGLPGAPEVVGTSDPDAIISQFKTAYAATFSEIPATWPALDSDIKEPSPEVKAEQYGRRTLEAIHGVQQAADELKNITVDTAVRMKDGLPDGTETIVRMGGHEWGISSTFDRQPSGPVPEVVAEVAAAGGVQNLSSTVNDIEHPMSQEEAGAIADSLTAAPTEEVAAPKGAFQRMMKNFFAEHQIGLFEKFFTSRVIEGGVGNIGMEPKPETWYLTTYGEDILRTGPIRTAGWPQGIYRDYKTKENQLFLRTQNFSFVITGLPTKPDAILYSLIRNGSASNFEHINEAPEADGEMAFIELLALVSELNWACKPSEKTE